MDGFDKLINNRALLKNVLGFFALTVVYTFLGWFFSAHIADIITGYIIESSLSAAGGGKFTALPDSSAIARAEEFYADYSISAKLSPRLMECWEPIRMKAFWLITAVCTALNLVWLVVSLKSLFKIYDQIEELRNDCLKIAEDTSSRITAKGEELSSIKRLSESLELIAERLSYVTFNLNNEKNFLSEFLTDFSHQLKNSLSVVRLNSDIILEMENLPGNDKIRLLNEIQFNLDGMEALVANAIKLAKLNADAIIYSMNETDISASCAESVKRIAPLLREKGISVNISEDSGIRFPHDRIWLCEAFENIIKNCADHSECSEISIEITSNPAMTSVIISDNGKGITQSEIPTIFKRFGKKSGNIAMTNAGIGMSIAHKIIAAHQGEIIVYSELGSGTRFEISFIM